MNADLKKPERDQLINFLISKEEKAALTRAALLQDLPVSTLVRRAVKREIRETVAGAGDGKRTA